MADPEKPSPLERLGKRIAAARDRHERKRQGTSKANSHTGLGLGLRIATEMVAALAIGVGIGLLLDRWLGTQPWLLILFFILGAAAAFMNLIRVAREAEVRQAEAKREEAGRPAKRETGQDADEG